jgi:hypothetical protein
VFVLICVGRGIAIGRFASKEFCQLSVGLKVPEASSKLQQAIKSEEK